MAQFGSATMAAGPYTVAYNSVALGLLRGGEQCPMVESQRFGQLIDNTHLYGRTPIGQIGLGGNGFASMIMMEWLTAKNQAVWPWNASGAGHYASTSFVGYDDFDSYAASLVFTAASGTMAATNGPATLTCPKAVIAEEFPIRVTLGPILREIPLRFRLFPSSSAALYFWSQT